MNKFIVRQPIKELDGSTFGYEILFNLENELYNQNGDYAVADTISSFLMQNSDKMTTQAMMFMTFTPNLLFRNTPKLFKQKELVIQIEDNVVIHPLAQKLIERYKESGYSICINDFQFMPRYFGLLDYVDYIKVNINVITDATSLNNILKLGKGFHKKCIITGIDNAALYEKAKEVPADYYQGSYVAEAMVTKSGKTEYLQSNFFQLVVAVTNDEPDMDEIESIIVRDASLTYALLRMVNSVHYALRHRTASVKQALMVLGINQLKQWVYLLSFDQTNTDKATEEVLRISFLRANFCSELYALIKDLEITKSEAYLMGMFSTIEALVDAPVEEVVKEIPVSDEVKLAIIAQEGKCGDLYNLVLSYEKADWKNIVVYADKLGIQTNMIAQIYFNCVEKVNEIWESFMQDRNMQQPQIEELKENQDIIE